MKTTLTPFTIVYAQWLDSFRANFPGGAPAIPPDIPTPQQEQVVAKQEWEGEGGSTKPKATPDAKPKKATARSKPKAKSKSKSKVNNKPKAKQARNKRR